MQSNVAGFQWIKPSQKIKVKLNKDTFPVIQPTQFPLMLQWAYTSHKVEGLSLDRAVVSFDLFKQKNFNYGKMYVVLSRLRSLSGLTLTGTFTATAIKADPRAIQEYERQRLESPLLSQTFPFVSCNSLTINLLNVRSLHKHSTDIACDQRLLQSDLLCFTETQVLIEQSTDSIKDCLRDFVILHNASPDRFQSIAFCYKHGIDIVSQVKSTGISYITLQKPSFVQYTLKMILCYRKNNPMASFLDTMEQINSQNEVHIILGDFNINIIEGNQRISTVLSNYTQIGRKPTHISVSSIDHVHIQNGFLESVSATSQVLGVHFSDHDPVRIYNSNNFVNKFS